jgi:hypothetical protein
MGFSSYFVAAREGKLSVAEGLEEAMATSCAFPAVGEDGRPTSLPSPRTLEQQLDAECRGSAMLRQKIHGSCTSSAIYQQTLLRALGVPTRSTVAMPPADGNDPAQIEMLQKGLAASALRDSILRGPSAGWNEHTFNLVRVGGRWRRLNYAALGQPIVDRNYLGLMLRILEYDDFATSGVAATWGKKRAKGERTARYPGGNPYRLLEVSDQNGPHVPVRLPPSTEPLVPPAPPRILTRLTITRTEWSAQFVGGMLQYPGSDVFEVTLGEAGVGEPDEPYTRFAKDGDVRFVLKAEGKPDVPAEYAWATVKRSGKQTMLFVTKRQDLAEGVAYRLVPKNEEGTNRWVVADEVRVRR